VAERTVRRVLLAVDVAVKIATVGLLVVALARPDLPQFTGKAFEGRAIAYPIALLILPIAWAARIRGRHRFPVAADMLIGLPFLIDMAGNALNLYDTIDAWDDLNHLANWALHTAGVCLLLRWTPLPPAARAGLGIAWAATSAILWELAEYVTFVPNSPEAASAYRDTLGDLALGLLGGTLAAFVIAYAPIAASVRPAVPAESGGQASGAVPAAGTAQTSAGQVPPA
jgi:hypothetical protein